MVAKDLFDRANNVLQKNIYIANVMIGYDLMIHFCWKTGGASKVLSFGSA